MRNNISLKTLWKNIIRSTQSSIGRFLSIAGLIAIGSFALVGLLVTGSNMRITGDNYFRKLNVADLYLIGEYGIDEELIGKISKSEDISKVEYGYMKDTTIKGTNRAIRIMSMGDELSKYSIVKGRMPEKSNEIALLHELKKDYKIGDKIILDKYEEQDGKEPLAIREYNIVGFINSGEYLLHKDHGVSAKGDGQLKSFGVVKKEAFNYDRYMIARISYDDLRNYNYFSKEYNNIVNDHKQKLESLIENDPERMLIKTRKEAQEEIDDGRLKLSEAKEKIEEGRLKLVSARDKLDKGENKYSNALKEYNEKISDGEKKLTDGKEKLEKGKEEINSNFEKLNEAEEKLNNGRQELTNNAKLLEIGKQELEKYNKILEEKKKELDENDSKLKYYNEKIEEGKKLLNKADDNFRITKNKEKLREEKDRLDKKEKEIKNMYDKYILDKKILEEKIKKSEIDETEKERENERLNQEKLKIENEKQKLEKDKEVYKEAKIIFDSAYYVFSKQENILKEKEKELNENIKKYNIYLEKYNAAKKEYEKNFEEFNQKKILYDNAIKNFEEKEKELIKNKEKLEQAKRIIEEKENEFFKGKALLESEKTKGLLKLNNAKKELEKGEKDYNDACSKYIEKKEEADSEIAKNEKELNEAQERVDSLKLPEYMIQNLNETYGSDGYMAYENISYMMDSLAKVFPVFLYFVAALVTSVTMTRFVSEERANSGTLKALGYSDRDIIKKFLVYGLTASVIGSLIGIYFGHTLIPNIVESAYYNKIYVPVMEKHYYPGIATIAFLASVICATVPAIIVAKKQLKEKAARLLLPKTPPSGNKTFLEFFPNIWNKFSFSKKVTLRNTFRYKKRMAMTIFGVAGSIALIFTGFAVRYSIASIKDLQFEDIIKYSMIVSKNSYVEKEEKEKINELLNSNNVEKYKMAHFDKGTIDSTKSNKTNNIYIITPENNNEISDYIKIRNKKTKKQYELKDDGVIITEKISEILGVKPGDEIIVKDLKGREGKVKINGISEMYISHFMFMTKDYYEKTFNKPYESNAYIVNLKDGKRDKVSELAIEFMKLKGVKGVVQNNQLKSQLDFTIQSLDIVMVTLIVIAIMLTTVILYNLTTINVSERIRELSTIKVLGFYDNEVSMYIYRETIILTILGIFAGYIIGRILQLYILNVIVAEHFMLNRSLDSTPFIISAIVVIGVTLILYFIVNNKLKNIEMLDALKSVD